MSRFTVFGQTLRKHGFLVAVIKSAAHLLGRRSLVEGVDEDFPVTQASDLSMPGPEDALLTHPGYARWNHVLPLPNDRMMLHIGAATVENFYVVADAWAQVLSRFIEPGSHVMDVGCGCGRTARLLAINPNVERFTGFDVVPEYIKWCQVYFDEQWPGRFSFRHLDVKTGRYNPDGQLKSDEARFPSDDGGVDFLYAASLFTHLFPEDIKHYAGEMARVVRPAGQALVSIHDQPEKGEQFSGTEHRADYDAAYFIDLLKLAGFNLREDLGDLCGQRTFLLTRVA